MEWNKHATAKNELVLEKTLDVVAFFPEQFVHNTDTEESPGTIETGEAIASSTLQPFKFDLV